MTFVLVEDVDQDLDLDLAMCTLFKVFMEVMHTFSADWWVIFSRFSINAYFRDSKGQCGQCLYGQKL